MEQTIQGDVARQRQQRLRELTALLASPDLAKRRDAIRLIIELRLPPDIGIPLFIENLRNSSPAVQQEVIRGLGEYGPAAGESVPALVRVLEDPLAMGSVRQEAAASIGKIKAHLSEALPALLRVVRHPATVFSVRLAVIEALGRLGIEAGSANIALTAALSDPMTEIQCAAFEALGKIEKGPGTFSLLADANRLEQAPPALSSQAFLSVRQAGPAGRAMVPTLVRVLETQQKKYFQCAAIAALGNAGAGKASATRALLAFVEGDDEFLAQLAGKALDTITPNDVEAVAPLTMALGSRSERARIQAGRSLARIGPAAAPAVSALIAALQNADKTTSLDEVDSILTVLDEIGPKAAAAGAAIVRALDPKSRLLAGRPEYELSYIPAHLFVTLSHIGVPAQAHALILKALQGSDPYQFAAAARAAGAWGPGAAVAVPFLMRALRPDYSDFYIWLSFLMHTTPRLEAIRALGSIGPAAVSAIPLLETITRGPALDLPFIEEAQAALQSIRGQGRPTRLPPRHPL